MISRLLGSNRFIAPTAALCLGALLSPSAFAQQFVQQVGAIPGPNRWTEGVEAGDIDNDGDFDLFFADGEGFSTPGPQRQNILVVNQLEIAAGQFSDQSIARLGVHVSHARGIATADIDGDGWLDALYSNGFNSDQPFLYINRGDAQPGFFDEEAGARGLNGGPYSSAGAGWTDLDNDGDLDLILLDSGNSFLFGAGDRPHLFFNDGAGNFTEDVAALGASIKRAHRAVQFVDIDNDWDMDFFGPNRNTNTGGNHYLMLNDGAGNFTDVSNIIPPTSSSVYEAEVGDLDIDGDLDMFFVSASGFQEGGVRNNLIGSGTLSFSSGPTLGGDDDNEIVMIDYDMDNDLDALVGSLSGNREKLHRNNGVGVFTNDNSGFAVLNDSTLDATAVDYDGDGAYDVITAQGESNPAQWSNKVYRNMGPVDTIPPVIQREEELVAPTATGPWVVRAVIYDQVMDDGKNWVDGSVTYRVNTLAGPGPEVTVPALPLGGNMYRFEMVDTAAGEGSALVYTLRFEDDNGNVTLSETQAVGLAGCGFTQYGAGAAPANVLELAGTGTGQPGTTLELVTTSAPAGGVFTGLGVGRAVVPFGDGAILINPLTVVLPLFFNPTVGGSSTLSLPLPANPGLVGIELNFQSFGVDTSLAGGLAFSNGLALAVCP